MSKRSNTQLLYTTLSVLKNSKKLLIFPFIGFSLFLIVLAIVLLPFTRYRYDYQPLTSTQFHQLLIPYLVFLIFLSVAHFILLFFNAAMTATLQNHFKKRAVNFIAGLKDAAVIFWQLVKWNTFASTIGIFIFLFPQTAKKIRWIEQLIDTQTWSIASYFVTPLLVMQNKSPIDALQTSSNLLQQTWGGHLVATFRFGGFILLARLISLIPLFIGLLLREKEMIIICTSLTAILYFFISILNTSIKTTICNALYFYAIEKKPPLSFNEKMLKNAFLPRYF